MARVLIVDDSELILQMLQMVVAQAGHEAVLATDWAAAEAAYDAGRPDLVVTDLNLPDVEDPIGSFLSKGDAPVVVVSGRPQAELDRLATERGAAGAISKDAGMMGMASALPDLIARLTRG